MRDLLLNNDHIHVVEQQMRQAIKFGLQVRQSELFGKIHASKYITAQSSCAGYPYPVDSI